MAFSKNDIKSEIILGLAGGGQIPIPLLDQRIDLCMKKVFTETGLLVLPRYINETNDEDLYSIKSGASGVSTHQHPADMETIRPIQLARVTHDDGTSTPTVATVKERTIIGKSYYSFVSAPNASKQELHLHLKDKSTETKNFALELYCAVSTADVDYVDPLYTQDFREALVADIKYYYMLETGRPWSNPNLAALEQRKFYEALNRLRFKTSTGFTDGTLSVSPTYGFII